MTTPTDLTLPMSLDDGLTLRWASAEDADALAAFNVRIHSDNPDQPDEWLGDWTRDLMLGDHPTTDASDFTVVVNSEGEIVSSLCLISQTWRIGEVAFPVGRVELVGTDERYRKRRLVRLQMDVIHARSAVKGEPVQAITGIPWYYRLFGYEMALDLHGSRAFRWSGGGSKPSAESEQPYSMHQATVGDIADLNRLYEVQASYSLVSRVCSEAEWRHELGEGSLREKPARNLWLIDSAETPAVAYIEYQQWGTMYAIRELGVTPGHSWRAVAVYLLDAFQRMAATENETRAEKPISQLTFLLGRDHPAYTVLDPQLDPLRRPYAYYMRVVDVADFLRRLTPVLEQRVADSLLAGYSGSIRINIIREHIKLTFEKGKLTEIGTFEIQKVQDGDVIFPEPIFLQALFGRQDFEALHETYPDCYAISAEARVLLQVLFPKAPSLVVAL